MIRRLTLLSIVYARQPISVNMEATDLVKEIDSALGAAYLHLHNTGACSTVQVSGGGGGHFSISFRPVCGGGVAILATVSFFPRIAENGGEQCRCLLRTF